MRGLFTEYFISKVMSGISYVAGRCSQHLGSHQDGLTASRTMATALRPCMHSRAVCSNRRSATHFSTSTNTSHGVAASWRKVNVWGRSYNAEEAVVSKVTSPGSDALPFNDVGVLVINPNLGTVVGTDSINGSTAAEVSETAADSTPAGSSASTNGHVSVEVAPAADQTSGEVPPAADSDGNGTAAEGTVASTSPAAAEEPASSSMSDSTAAVQAAEPSSSSSPSEDNSSSAPPPSSSADGADESSPSSNGVRAGPAIRLLLQSGAAMLPHPDKAHRGGEDSFFIADHQSAIGVADGVGGWAEIGVDAGAYARLLMVHAKDAADNAAQDLAAGTLSAQQILETAFYKTNVQGSSTACVLVVNGTTLSASNLGDSGFVLVRDGVATFQCPQQQHNFNFPFQLGSADSMSDQPQAAMRFELELQPGDIVVTGSDGLWDNIFAEEAATIASKCRDKGESATTAAQVLCRYARMRASDAKYHSPFSYAAIQAGYVYLGGKMDDITVLVSYVTLPPAKL